MKFFKKGTPFHLNDYNFTKFCSISLKIDSWPPPLPNSIYIFWEIWFVCLRWLWQAMNYTVHGDVCTEILRTVSFFLSPFDGISAKYMGWINKSFLFWLTVNLTIYCLDSRFITFMNRIEMFFGMSIFHSFWVYEILNKFITMNEFKTRKISNSVLIILFKDQSVEMRKTWIFNGSRNQITQHTVLK